MSDVEDKPEQPSALPTSPPHSESSSSLDTEKANSKQTSDSQDEVDGGYGWVCVVCMFLITANTWGVNGAFGVYLAYYINNNVFQGASEIEYAFVGGLLIGNILLVSPLVTVSNAKLGTRATLTIGTIMEAGALVAAGFASKLWHIFLTQGLLLGWGCGFLYLGASPVVPQWFTKRKGFATAMAAAGSGAGGLLYSMITEVILRRLSLGWAFHITAISTFVMNAACTLLMQDRNKAIKSIHSPVNLSLFKSLSFCWIQAWAFLSVLGYTMVLFSAPDYVTRLGYSEFKGALAGAIVNAGMMIGRPIVGFYSDRLGRSNLVVLTSLLSCLWCLALWIPARNYATILAFCALSGSVLGTVWTVTSPLLADSLGIQALPSALSLTWLVLVLPGLFAEPIAVGLRKTTLVSPYLAVQIFAGLVFFVAAVSGLLLRRELSRQKQKKEQKQTGKQRWLAVL